MAYLDSFGKIEVAMQRAWHSERIDYVDLKKDRAKKLFVLGMFPYPSGNAHMGHILVYSIADALARLGRFKGCEVLNPIGWDSFGLPAENAAIQNGVNPAEWTRSNIDKMRGPQIGRAGFSFDLTKEIDTSSPEFYRWTQWLFLKLWEHGQAYRANAWVNWDPIDQTVLANEQVIDGKGWRSGAPVERRLMEQWYLRITSFAEALWQGLDDLTGWSDRAIAAQRNWIGRSEGYEIDFPVVGEPGRAIRVFTTRPDTVYGVTSVTLAPEHELTMALAAFTRRAEIEAYVEASILKNEIDRQADSEKSGVPLGRQVLNPLTGEAVPVFVGDYVLANYGTGAIMNVPAHDQRDFEFARSRRLEIRTVIQPGEGKEVPSDAAFVGEGIMVASGPFNGLGSDEARVRIGEHIERTNLGKRVVRFRLRDWSVSRQRFWGAPIPMLRRQDGSWEPVPESQLPVRLPVHVDFAATAGKSMLASDPTFYECVSPTDGTPCTREVDTMDTFMCSAWYAWRFLDPTSAEQPFDQAIAHRWMPIDYYVGGLEHANQHLIYFRYISYFLNSIGYTSTKEPVAHFLDNGIIQKDGFKMSKSRGNVVRPDEVMERYGADALRLYVFSDTPYSRDREWDDSGLIAKQRFLASIWSIYAAAAERAPMHAADAAPVTDDFWSLQLLASLYHLAEDTEKQIEERQAFHVVVARIHAFVNNLRAAVDEATDPTRVAVLSFVLQNFLKVLGLFCPHIADSIWRHRFDERESLFRQPWVPIDRSVIQQSAQTVSVAVSVDGKRRSVLEVAKDIDDAGLEEILARDGAGIERYLTDRELVRIVIVRGGEGEPKLLNVVTAVARQ